jgi:cytochrome P450
MPLPSVRLDVFNDSDPVALLDQTLRCFGGAFLAVGDRGPDVVYFHPSSQRLSEFHAAERAGTLINYNTKAVHQLFDKTVFTLTGDAHRRARINLVRYFGPRGPWQSEVDAAIRAWVDDASEQVTIDLLDQTRALAQTIFTRVVFGIDPRSPQGLRIASLARRFLAGAIAAAAEEPDSNTLRDAAACRDELIALFRAVGLGAEDTSFASYVRREPREDINTNDVSAVLVASVETTANLLAWTILRWLYVAPSDRGDLQDFAREVEQAHSPNTLITRQAVTGLTFAGEQLTSGTLVSYSPAADPRLPANQLDPKHSARRATAEPAPVTFGSGRRACPGRSMAQYTVDRTITILSAHASDWSLVANTVPRPVSWFPVQTFGMGLMVRTRLGAGPCR